MGDNFSECEVQMFEENGNKKSNEKYMANYCKNTNIGQNTKDEQYAFIKQKYVNQIWIKSVVNKTKTPKQTAVAQKEEDIFGDFDNWSIHPFDDVFDDKSKQNERKKSIIIQQSQTECIIDSDPFGILQITEQKQMAQTQNVQEIERKNTKSDIMNLFKTINTYQPHHGYYNY